MNQTGLILEGGGMRGAYTAGVLDYFQDHGVEFPFVVGASAGACVATSYISHQRERNYKVLVEYGSHPEYISFKRLLKGQPLFGMDFIFDTLPNQLVPFDYESFKSSQNKLVIATTDIHTGKPIYYDQFNHKDELLKIVRASSSLPFIASSISYQGRELMDGGISDPIPINPSIYAGNQKHVVVLTRNKGYYKKAMKFKTFIRRKYKNYPQFIYAMEKRHEKYNQTLKQLRIMEQAGEVFIIQPKHPLEVSRVERDKHKLHQLYVQGYEETGELYKNLTNFIQGA